MGKYKDGVILVTGEEVPEPIIYRTYMKLKGFTPFVLDQLRRLCLTPTYKINSTALRTLQKAEIVDSDGKVYDGIREIAMASIIGTNLDCKIDSPVPFPLAELVTLK